MAGPPMARVDLSGLEQVSRSDVDRKLVAYLRGHVPGDRLKSDLYVDQRLRRAQQLLRDEASRYRSIDPARYEELLRMLGSDTAEFLQP